MALTSAPGIDAMDLRGRLAAGGVAVIDFDLNRRYALGHIPDAWFATGRASTPRW